MTVAAANEQAKNRTMKRTHRVVLGKALILAVARPSWLAAITRAIRFRGLKKGDTSKPGIIDTKNIAEEAYIYGFPMIANYKAL